MTHRSRQETRAQLRALPRERRRDVQAALREGRAVRDPRDAALAATLAERMETSGARVPWWIIPLRRQRGWRAWVWPLHLVWFLAALGWACKTLVPRYWLWIVLAFLAYVLVAVPAWRRLLQLFWNAPEAARKNRELASLTAGRTLSA